MTPCYSWCARVLASSFLVTLFSIAAPRSAAAQLFQDPLPQASAVPPLRQIRSGDLNKDGRRDLAVVDANGTLWKLLNDGNGVFLPAAIAGGISDLVVADMNGDGHDDYIVAGATFPVQIGFAGVNGDLIGVTTAPSVVGATRCAVGDMDGDGRNDVVVFSNGTVATFVNRDGLFVPASTPRATAPPIALAAADVNGDGRADLMVLSADAVQVLYSGEDPTGYSFSDTVALGPTLKSLEIGDVNGDTRPDLLVGGADFVGVMLNVNGRFFSSQRTATAGSSGSIAVGDFNDDGKLDAAVGRTTAELWVLPGTGTGIFRAAIPSSVNGSSTLVRAIDVDGDSRLDIVSIAAARGGIDVLLRGAVIAPSDATLDTVQQKVDKIAATLTSGVDTNVGSRASQGSVDAIRNILQLTLDTQLSSRASSAEVQAIATAVQRLQSGVTKADLDALSASIATLVGSARDTLLRAKIEEALQQNLQTSLYSTTASAGGLLDRVRAIVADVLARSPAGNDADRAQRLVAEGDAASSAGDYRGAFKKYAEAYRALNR
jgi:hypothetical protein